jgi:tRNA(His) 5'-end guanylyltransferase
MNKVIGLRIKQNYENRYRFYLTRRTPVILRIDGKCFHTLLKNVEKPFDNLFSDCMKETAIKLCEEITGARCAYLQSDEISILITDFQRLKTQAWFDYNIQKMSSVGASIATFAFIEEYYAGHYLPLPDTFFDCRVFNIPKEEVVNYFVWRQKDWISNSVQMLVRTYYSHEECQGMHVSTLHEMLHKKEVNWADLEHRWKNGRFIYLDQKDRNKFVEIPSPIFTDSATRQHIEEVLMEAG